jgi:hypothetical protein
LPDGFPGVNNLQSVSLGAPVSQWIRGRIPRIAGNMPALPKDARRESS